MTATVAAAVPRRLALTPARVGLAVLLAGTAALYLIGLGASGWANTFYSAAAQAGGQSWEAFLYGSSDAANAITVDKTPAFLWVIDGSVRLFGLNAWSILVPQALEGVAAVAVLYATVRRWFGAGAGLLAGAVLAVTPVATLMFRFNNPDALLVLLLTAAAYATVRAVERHGGRFLLLAGVLLGFGFLTKMLQALILVPVLAGVYLLASRRRLRRRFADLALGAAGLVAAAGWYLALVALVPASSRPYIGGTQHDSILELTLGYNGFGRLTGDETGGLGNTNADAGPLRLFGDEMGGQIAWLLPAAVLLGAVVLGLTRRTIRTDRTRAAVLLWGGWLVLTGAVFSLSNGIIHPYYTVALAPAIAALVGIGTVVCWHRHRLALAGAVAVTAVWAYLLLDRAPDWQPWLRYAVVGLGLLTAAVLALAARFPGVPVPRRAVAVAGVLALVAGLAAPLGYSVATAATPHTGALPSAGPASFGTGPRGGPGGGGPGAGTKAFGGTGNGAAAGGGAFGGGGPGPGGGRNTVGGNGNGNGNGAATGGGVTGPSGTAAGPPGAGTGPSGPNGGTAGRAGHGFPGPGGGMGGLLAAPTPSASVVTLLRRNQSRYDWVAATVGSNNAAGYQLAAGGPVLAVGGFNGTDAFPTLAQFRRYVAQGRIHWFIGGSMPTGSSGSQAPRQIAAWVAKHYQARTVGGVTLYDLS